MVSLVCLVCLPFPFDCERVQIGKGRVTVKVGARVDFRDSQYNCRTCRTLVYNAYAELQQCQLLLCTNFHGTYISRW